MIKVLESPAAFRAEMLALRQRNLRLALVPTMGYLHRGHTQLIEHATQHADVVAISIFVNPMQFGPKEDLASYPRDLLGDLAKAEAAGAALAFVPADGSMYPQGFQTRVEVTELTRGLCGASRPEHFRGVTTVVLKLFNLAQPHVAVFGEKDYQQLATIRRMVRDLDVPVEVRSIPTVREADGLAMSSRNALLTPEQRQDALVLGRVLDGIDAEISHGERRREVLVGNGLHVLAQLGGVRCDYLDVVNADTLVASSQIESPSQALIAAFVGRTRLIDNRRVL